MQRYKKISKLANLIAYFNSWLQGLLFFAYWWNKYYTKFLVWFLLQFHTRTTKRVKIDFSVLTLFFEEICHLICHLIISFSAICLFEHSAIWMMLVMSTCFYCYWLYELPLVANSNHLCLSLIVAFIPFSFATYSDMDNWRTLPLSGTWFLYFVLTFVCHLFLLSNAMLKYHIKRYFTAFYTFCQLKNKP